MDNEATRIASGLSCDIRQQDGSVVTMRYSDTLTNRSFTEYIRRMEGFYKPDRVRRILTETQHG